MTLRREVVYFVRLHHLHDAHETARVRHIPVMQNEPAFGHMRVLIQVVDPLRVEERRAALDPMHHIALLQQKFGQIGAVLPGNARDQRSFLHAAAVVDSSRGIIAMCCPQAGPNIRNHASSKLAPEENYFLSKDEFAKCGRDGRDVFLLEPCGRNTAPAVAMAAFRAAATHGDDAELLVLPADHLIDDQPTFRGAVNDARKLAHAGTLVTFGIAPSRPETGYGYIECGAPLHCRDGFRVSR